VSGIASETNRYFFNGVYSKQIEMVNNAPVFGYGGWKMSLNTAGNWVISYGVGGAPVAWGVRDDFWCPAFNNGWTWWNSVTSVVSDDSNGVVVTTDSTPTTPGPPTTTPAGPTTTTPATTTTNTPTNCDVVWSYGADTVPYHMTGKYEFSGTMINGKKQYVYEIPGLWMLFKDGSWRVTYDPTNADMMLAYGTTDSDCPADASAWAAYDGVGMETRDDFYVTKNEADIPAIPTPAGAPCSSFTMASKTNNPPNFAGFGTYQITGDEAFGWPIWQNEHGFRAEMTDKGMVNFSKGGEARTIYGTVKGPSCFAPTASEPAGKWNIWTGTQTVYGDDIFGVNLGGTADGCLEVFAYGDDAVPYYISGSFHATGELLNGKKIYEHDPPGLWLAFADGNWRVIYDISNPKDLILGYSTSGDLACPADTSSWNIYNGVEMVSVDDFFLTTDETTIPAISPPDGATCEQFSLASSSNNPPNFGAYGTYSRTAAVVFDWPVYQNENGWLAEMNKLGFWWISKVICS